jgi:hypothetical protein
MPVMNVGKRRRKETFLKWNGPLGFFNGRQLVGKKKPIKQEPNI